MGDVVAVLKVMPEDPEMDLDELSTTLQGIVPADADWQGTETEKVAFGLEALNVTVVLADVEGGPDAVQEAFEKVQGVQSVQVTDVGRM